MCVGWGAMGAVRGSGGAWLQPQGGQHPWDRPPVQGTDPGRHPKARLGSPPGLGAGGRLQPLLHSTNIFPSNLFCVPLTFLRLQFLFPSTNIFPAIFLCPEFILFFPAVWFSVHFFVFFYFFLPCRIIFFGTPEASWDSWRIKKFFFAPLSLVYIILYFRIPDISIYSYSYKKIIYRYVCYPWMPLFRILVASHGISRLLWVVNRFGRRNSLTSHFSHPWYFCRGIIFLCAVVKLGDWFLFPFFRTFLLVLYLYNNFFSYIVL